jgi:hypothetical protein
MKNIIILMILVLGTMSCSDSGNRRANRNYVYHLIDGDALLVVEDSTGRINTMRSNPNVDSVKFVSITIITPQGKLTQTPWEIAGASYVTEKEYYTPDSTYTRIAVRVFARKDIKMKGSKDEF